jgi:hypothetical protein
MNTRARQRRLRSRHLVAVGMLAVVTALTIVSAGCTPRQAGEGTAAGGATDGSTTMPSVTVQWSPETDCSSCHNKQAATQQDSLTAAGIHQAVGTGCMGCHDDETALAKVHVDVVAGPVNVKRLKATSVEPETCVTSGCHSDGAEWMAATASSTMLTDYNGRVVNPHDLPTSERHSELTCSSCHAGHQEFDPMAACLTCHHMETFEPCSKCHES